MYVAVRFTCNLTELLTKIGYVILLREVTCFRVIRQSGSVERRHGSSVVENCRGNFFFIDNCSNLMHVLKWKTNAVGVYVL